MDGRRFAVVAGVNRSPQNVSAPDLRYAEDDARDLYEVLTTAGRGTFSRTDAKLLLGAEATSEAISEALQETVLASRPADTLLVFFAGHAWLPPAETVTDAYLVTCDLDPHRVRLHPEAGIRMRDLRLDVFERFHGSSLLVLDCCHAGQYAEHHGEAAHRALVSALSAHETHLPKHTALMSCPADATARETDALRHGVLTHHLLVGLRGEAAGPDGCVTSANAVDYVRSRRLQPDPGVFARDWGPPIVLTCPRPGSEATVAAALDRRRLGFVGAANPLEPALPLIIEMLDRGFADGLDDNSMNVERIRRLTNAEGTIIGRFSADGVEVQQHSAQLDVDGWRGILSRTVSHLREKRRESLAYLGIENDGRQALFVPVRHRSSDEIDCLVVVNPDDRFLQIGEPLGAILAAVWHGDPTDARLQQVEAITALRTGFGRLPLELYRRSLSLYRRVLGSGVMVFQPVVRLHPDPRVVHVHSYEALARRDAESTVAPVRMLNVARVWGDQFLIERDSSLAAKAIRAYADAHRRCFADGQPKPVSINVSVRALLSEAYETILADAIRDAGLDPTAIALEISERDPITPTQDEEWDPDPFTFFAERLRDLAVRLDGVAFALDDFGVGYANLDRLSALLLTQIKIDRSILRHERPLALYELELVVRVARHALKWGTQERPVIVEGVDDKVKVSLQDIFQANIKYVQGFITELPASAELHPPSDDRFKERVAARVRGEQPDEP